MENICSNYRSDRLLVTCIYCRNNFETINDRKVRCLSCFDSIERKLKTYTFEKLKKLAYAYNTKRKRKEYILEEVVQKVEN